MTRFEMLTRTIWQQNAASGPNMADVIVTYGSWTLAAVLADLNPCGPDCRAFLGNGHVPDCTRPLEWDYDDDECDGTPGCACSDADGAED